MKGHVRHQFYLPLALSSRLDALAARPGVTKSAILVDAVEAWLDRKAAHALDARFALRLDRMTQALSRIERNGHILLETLALYIRYELAINPPLAENDEAGRAMAARRFNAFVLQVTRQIASGRHSIGGESLGEPQ